MWAGVRIVLLAVEATHGWCRASILGAHDGAIALGRRGAGRGRVAKGRLGGRGGPARRVGRQGPSSAGCRALGKPPVATASRPRAAEGRLEGVGASGRVNGAGLTHLSGRGPASHAAGARRGAEVVVAAKATVASAVGVNAVGVGSAGDVGGALGGVVALVVTRLCIVRAGAARLISGQASPTRSSARGVGVGTTIRGAEAVARRGPATGLGGGRGTDVIALRGV